MRPNEIKELTKLLEDTGYSVRDLIRIVTVHDNAQMMKQASVNNSEMQGDSKLSEKAISEEIEKWRGQSVEVLERLSILVGSDLAPAWLHFRDLHRHMKVLAALPENIKATLKDLKTPKEKMEETAAWLFKYMTTHPFLDYGIEWNLDGMSTFIKNLGIIAGHNGTWAFDTAIPPELKPVEFVPKDPKDKEVADQIDKMASWMLRIMKEHIEKYHDGFPCPEWVETDFVCLKCHSTIMRKNELLKCPDCGFGAKEKK